jgi:hypothetical protein
MDNLTTNHKVAPVSTFDETARITITKPISDTEVEEVLKKWVDKQDDFWPPEITSDVLISKLQCVFASYWLLYANASGSWSASIGTSHTEIEICSFCGGKGETGPGLNGYKKCTSCRGSGRKEKKVTVWNRQSGVTSASINGRVIKNYSDDISLSCGERDLKAKEYILQKPFPEDIYVLQPKQTDPSSGEMKAKKHVREEIKQKARRSASTLGRVRDLQMAYVDIEDVDSRIWLYPIFLGSYDFDENSHFIQVDGATGQLHIEIPWSIRKQRILRVLKIIGIIAAIGVAIYMILLGLDALGVIAL